MFGNIRFARLARFLLNKVKKVIPKCRKCLIWYQKIEKNDFSTAQNIFYGS